MAPLGHRDRLVNEAPLGLEAQQATTETPVQAVLPARPARLVLTAPMVHPVLLAQRALQAAANQAHRGPQVPRVQTALMEVTERPVLPEPMARPVWMVLRVPPEPPVQMVLPVLMALPAQQVPLARTVRLVLRVQLVLMV